MPIIIGPNVNEAFAPPTSTITLEEFRLWRQKLIEWNQQMQIDGIVDLSNESNIIFFKRETLINLTDPNRNVKHLVFQFVCNEKEKKFVNLSVFAFGYNELSRIVTDIYRGHNRIGETDEPVGKGKPEGYAILKMGIANKLSRDAIIMINKPQLGFLTDEYDGYAHDSTTVRRWLDDNLKIENIALCLAVDTREEKLPNRTTVVLVGTDGEQNFLFNSKANDDLPIDNGAQCCPIP